jgi:hypothetical protein
VKEETGSVSVLISYNAAINDPLVSMLSPRGFCLFPSNFPQEVKMGNYSRSPTLIRCCDRDAQFEACTDNLGDYLAGLLLMSEFHYLTVSDSMMIFQILDSSNYNNYELVSLLSEFELTSLPIELISQILSYYPADWYCVSKDFYNIVKEELISDIRVRYRARVKKALDIMKNDLTKKQVNLLQELINQSNSHLDLLPFISEMVDNTKSLMKTLTDKILQTCTLTKYINDFFVRDSRIVYLSWLFENYEDAYYVADQSKILKFLANDTAHDIESKFVYLFTARILLVDPTTIFNSSCKINGSDLYKLTKDVISSNGTLVKTRTNPFTRNTREGYLDKSISTNVLTYIMHLLRYINYSHAFWENQYSYFTDTILCLVQNFSIISDGLNRWRVLELFVDVGEDMKDPEEVIKYINFVLPLIINDNSLLSLIVLLLFTRLEKDPRRKYAFSNLSENEIQTMIDPLERILTQGNYCQYYKESNEPLICTSEVLMYLEVVTESLEQGNLRSRYQHLVDYVTQAMEE